jgi:hypothetical protein
MAKWRIRVERLDEEYNILYQGQHEITDEMIAESRLGEKEMMSMAFLQCMHRLEILRHETENRNDTGTI